MKIFQHLKISADSAHSRCTTNLRNHRKVCIISSHLLELRIISRQNACLKLISNHQNQKKNESGQIFTGKITTRVMWYKNWLRLAYSCCMISQVFITSYLTYSISTLPLTFPEKKMENFKRLKISADFADLLCTTNPRNQRKNEKTSYY